MPVLAVMVRPSNASEVPLSPAVFPPNRLVKSKVTSSAEAGPVRARSRAAMVINKVHFFIIKSSSTACSRKGLAALTQGPRSAKLSVNLPGGKKLDRITLMPRPKKAALPFLLPGNPAILSSLRPVVFRRRLAAALASAIL
jgi:hypothetical protein